MEKSVPQLSLEQYLVRRYEIKLYEKKLRVLNAQQILAERDCPWIKNVIGQLEKAEEEHLKQHPADPLQELLKGGLEEQAAQNFLDLEAFEKEERKKKRALENQKKLEKQRLDKSMEGNH